MSDKYPRIPHLPWSAGGTADDDRLGSVEPFLGTRVRVTEKLDGENRGWTCDAVYARSHAAPTRHPSAAWSKAAWAERRSLIRPGISVFLEDCFALHSIWYRRMVDESMYLFVLGVRDDEHGIWWACDDVDRLAGELALPTAPVLFEGIVGTEDDLRRWMPGGGSSTWGGVPIANGSRSHSAREGEVVRLCGPIASCDFASSVAKAVRPGHVQTDEHWRSRWRPQSGWHP